MHLIVERKENVIPQLGDVYAILVDMALTVQVITFLIQMRATKTPAYYISPIEIRVL